MIRYRGITERPKTFGIDYSHYLAMDNVFASLGNNPGTRFYHDSSYCQNHGTLTSTCEINDWRFDDELKRWKLQSDGYSYGDTAVVPNYRTLVSLNDFSLCYWMRLTAWTNTSTAIIYPVSIYYFTSNQRCWAEQIRGSSASSPADAMPLVLSTNGTDVNTLCPIARTSLVGDWHHVARIRSGSTVSTYLDGVYHSGGTLAGALHASTAEMGINARADTEYFHEIEGSLCDIMIYRRAVSVPEIRELADRENVMLSGLILPLKRRWWAPYSGAAPPAKKIPVFMNQYRQRK